MNKIILNLILIAIIIVNSAISSDKKFSTFITTVGSSYSEANILAHKMAYQNNSTITYKRISKNGDTWVVIARITQE